MPLYVCNGEEMVETFALLDGGANRHVVSKDICRKLNLHGKTMNMRITTLDKTVEGERDSRCDREGNKRLYAHPK